MTPDRYAQLIAAADRLWAASRALDVLTGNRVASDWTAEKVRRLIRSGEANAPAKVGAIADALEARLASDTDAAQKRRQA